jgi:hypothetical protein
LIVRCPTSCLPSSNVSPRLSLLLCPALPFFYEWSGDFKFRRDECRSELIFEEGQLIFEVDQLTFEYWPRIATLLAKRSRKSYAYGQWEGCQLETTCRITMLPPTSTEYFSLLCEIVNGLGSLAYVHLEVSKPLIIPGTAIYPCPRPEIKY